MRSFDVFLSDTLVGQLVDDEQGRVAFQRATSYRALPRRPVLGQQMEDDLDATYEGAPGRLPAFFANLVPEGPTRDLLVRSTGVPSQDDLGLLSAVGVDLPGGIVIRPSSAPPPFALDRAASEGDASTRRGEGAGLRLRFSVAGVQLKFSVLREGENVVLPVQDDYGEWLLKLDSALFPGLVANEFATMEWARAAGFEVPECLVVSPESLPAPLRTLDRANQPAFLIERYDRGPGGRVHQEDMAQVLGLYPECKYGRQEDSACPAVSYTQLLSVLRGLSREDYLEGLRRLALMVATGNDDAHLKNWSLLYPDGIRPRLSPLYDQVAVAAWRDASVHWALVWNGGRNTAKRTTLTTVSRLAERIGESGQEAVDLTRDVLERLATSWPAVSGLYPDGHADSIRQFWKQVPVLRPLASRLS